MFFTLIEYLILFFLFHKFAMFNNPFYDLPDHIIDFIKILKNIEYNFIQPANEMKIMGRELIL